MIRYYMMCIHLRRVRPTEGLSGRGPPCARCTSSAAWSNVRASPHCPPRAISAAARFSDATAASSACMPRVLCSAADSGKGQVQWRSSAQQTVVRSGTGVLRSAADSDAVRYSVKRVDEFTSTIIKMR
eukprot:339816-Pyramimonas_sp.AAC.1